MRTGWLYLLMLINVILQCFSPFKQFKWGTKKKKRKKKTFNEKKNKQKFCKYRINYTSTV